MQLLLIKIKAIMNYHLLNKALWQYCIFFLILLTGFILKKIIISFLNNKAKKFVKKTKTKLDDMILKIISKPIGWIVLLISFYIAIYFLNPPIKLQKFITGLTKSLSLFVLAYTLYAFVDLLSLYLDKIAAKTESKLDDQLIPIIRKTLRVGIVILFTVLIIENFGYDVGSILAGLGLGGLAFALAAKDTVSNIFGSITVFTDKPFIIGDRIVVAGHDGVVEEIGLRSTRLRTLAGHLISIPNSKMTSNSIENISKRPFIKHIFNIGITYDTPIEKVKLAINTIKNIMNTTENLLDGYSVFFNEFANSYLNIKIVFKVTPPDYNLFMETNESIHLRIFEEFNKLNIEFAFPTQTIYTKEG